MIYLIYATDLFYEVGQYACESGMRAGIAMAPTFYGFSWKSALQTGAHFDTTYTQSLRQSCKVIPTVVATVGYQNACFKFLKQYYGYNDYIAAFIAAFASSPLYVIFNGQSLGLNPSQSLRAMNFAQVSNITAREFLFVLSLNISKPITQKITDYLGDNLATKNTTYFGIGFVGSILGHPFDTFLTRSQAKAQKMPIKNTYINGFLRSVGPKALTTGLFNVFYQNALFYC